MPLPALVAALSAIGSGAGAAAGGAAGAGGKGAAGAGGLGAAASGGALGSTAGTGLGGAVAGNTGALMSGEGLGGLLTEMPFSSMGMPESGNLAGADAGGLLEMGPPEGLGGGGGGGDLGPLAARGQALRAGTLQNLAQIMAQGQRQRF